MKLARIHSEREKIADRVALTHDRQAPDFNTNPSSRCPMNLKTYLTALKRNKLYTFTLFRTLAVTGLCHPVGFIHSTRDVGR